MSKIFLNPNTEKTHLYTLTITWYNGRPNNSTKQLATTAPIHGRNATRKTNDSDERMKKRGQSADRLASVDVKPQISKALRYGPCVTMGSHIFTCLPHTNHTFLYTPAARRHRPLTGEEMTYEEMASVICYVALHYIRNYL